MKEIPLLFTGPLVLKIMADLKTQTRRLKFSGKPGDRVWVKETWGAGIFGDVVLIEYKADGHLREFNYHEHPITLKKPAQAARGDEDGVWRPSIFLPRWASRILLEVLAVREEPLQAITEEEARAEGLDWASPIFLPGDDDGSDDREDPREVGYPPAGASFALQNFRRLWDVINGKRAPWASNPTVKVVTFRRLPCPSA